MTRPFNLRLRFEPHAEDRAQLAAYPAKPLFPDFIVVTSGYLAFDLGPHAIAYRQGHRIDLPAGSTDAEAWLPDYVGGFLLALAEAIRGLEQSDHQVTEARLIDAPAGLTFDRRGDRVTISYLDGPEAVHSATLPFVTLRALVASVIGAFLVDLLMLNPRLATQADVAKLQNQQAALALPLPAPPRPLSR